MSNGELWERHAQWWINGFTDGVDPEYTDQIIPIAVSELEGMKTVLDVGCGDGQIGRALSANGAAVVGVDPTWGQISVAAERGKGPLYACASASNLPVANASCDAVLACLVFEHIDDVDSAIAEISRVLKPGGMFAFFLNHPLLQTPGSGWIDDHFVEPPEQYWRIGAYLVETASVEEVEKDVFIRFVHRPLSRYINALSEHSLVLEQMIEPSPPESFLEKAPDYRLAYTIPRLLYLRLRKVL